MGYQPFAVAPCQAISVRERGRHDACYCVTRLIAVPPPLIYLLAFLAGLVADKAMPWRPALMHSFYWMGLLLIAIGIALGPASAMMFLFRRTTLIPARQPSKLITGGAFRISRNPMYLGLAAIYAGLAIAFGCAWSLIFLPVPLLLMNAVFIPFEEAQSRNSFGKEYIAYCRKVRRWL